LAASKDSKISFLLMVFKNLSSSIKACFLSSVI
jgi:hypothetical protein